MQQVQPKYFERAHQAGEFEHMCKITINYHNLEIHTIHQEIIVLYHTLCYLQEIHEAHGKVTRGARNPFKKIVSTKGQHQQETRLQHDIIEESKS